AGLEVLHLVAAAGGIARRVEVDALARAVELAEIAGAQVVVRDAFAALVVVGRLHGGGHRDRRAAEGRARRGGGARGACCKCKRHAGAQMTHSHRVYAPSPSVSGFVELQGSLNAGAMPEARCKENQRLTPSP